MAKLTQMQQLMLAEAAKREDGVASKPTSIGKPAARKVGSSLVARKLLREVRAKPGMPIWREDEKGKSYCLAITSAGRVAIGDVKAQKRAPTANTNNSESLAPSRKNAASSRGGTKQALVVEMLSQAAGATVAALMEATGWLPHTTRAALTGLRKKGYAIERLNRAGAEPSAYRIVDAEKRAA
jgi:hypothetical protein